MLASPRFHLRPYRIPMDTLRQKHSAVLDLVTTLLGETNHARHMLVEEWLPAHQKLQMSPHCHVFADNRREGEVCGVWVCVCVNECAQG